MRNGEKASFWYERWTPLGCLNDILRDGGSMALGIPKNATVAESRDHRRRYHQFPILKKVEETLNRG